MPNTQFLNIPYPDEFDDPFWDEYTNQMNSVDYIVFLQKLMNNLFLGGGGTRTWNGGSGLLTWTSDWIVPVYQYGQTIHVKFGPDNVTRGVSVLDGQALMIQIPAVLNQQVNVNFAAVNQLTPTLHNQWVAGWRSGTKLQLKGIGELG